MSKLQLINLCAYFSQLEERMLADCMPQLAARAYKQYCRYKLRLNAWRVRNECA